MAMLLHQEFEEKQTDKALEMLLVDRKNEFEELAETILWNAPTYKTSIKDWEKFILSFTLDVSKAFKSWSGEIKPIPNAEMKALTILRQVARDKPSMIQMTHLLNIAYDLAEEFKVIYKRI